jgi:hypothetical protein
MKKYINKDLILNNINNIEYILNCEYLITNDRFSNNFLNKLISDKKFKKLLEKNFIDLELHSVNIFIYLHKDTNIYLVNKLNFILKKNEDLDYYKELMYSKINI